MSRIDWQALATEVNANARAKGFRDAPRPWAREVWLINTEVGEAGRAYQNSPGPRLWADISEELCDVVIRCLDTVAHHGLPLDLAKLAEFPGYEMKPVPFMDFNGPVRSILAAAFDDTEAEMIAALGQLVTVEDAQTAGDLFTRIIALAGNWHTTAGIDFAAALRSKVDKNAGRPYRHGGKRA